MHNQPLVTIIGPTASGKTSLAIQLAQKLNGEIICADSRTIYKGLDIGTAKPTREEQAQVQHWGIDIASPGDTYTVKDFQAYVYEKIADIRSRGKVPFLVGGTGLYVDAVVYEYDFSTPMDLEKRAYFEQFSLSELHEYCIQNNIKLPENERNKRHVVNTIIRGAISHKRNDAPQSTSIIVGIATERSVLRGRITARAHVMFDDDVVNEATKCAERYGWEHEAMKGNIYPIIRAMTEGNMSRQEAIDRFIISDMGLAKRQVTWFRRNPYIYWGSPAELAYFVEQYFTNEYKMCYYNNK